MTEPTLDTLTQRLDWLERENRRLKVAGVILLLALAAVGAMGQMTPRAVPKVVEAERFVLRDTKGNSLAIMGTEASGTSLSLYDQKGKPRAWLGVTADGAPVLALFDQNGKDRAGLALGADGTPALALLDQNGKRRAVLSTLVDGTPGLLFADQNEKGRAGLGQLPDGTPALFLADQNGKVRAGLNVATSGPSLLLRDENQHDRVLLGHTELGKTATGTVEQRPASSLVLFDKDGKVIWKAP